MAICGSHRCPLSPPLALAWEKWAAVQVEEQLEAKRRVWSGLWGCPFGAKLPREDLKQKAMKMHVQARWLQPCRVFYRLFPRQPGPRSSCARASPYRRASRPELLISALAMLVNAAPANVERER